MNDLLKDLRNGPKAWKKALAIIFSLLLIVAFFPKESKFQYEFQKGMPWLHEDLLAPFDFAIYKNAEQIKEEEQRIIDKSIPFFVFNQEVSKREVDEFESEFHSKWDSLESFEHDGFPSFAKQEDINFGISVLNKIYSAGLILSHESIENRKAGDGIYITKDQAPTYTDIEDVYTINQAIAFVEDELNNRPTSTNEMLEELLKDHLAPNLTFDEESSARRLKDQLESISLSYGKISQNEKVIGKGELVDEKLYQKLSSLKREFEARSRGDGISWILIIGQVLIAAISLFALLLFLTIFSHDILKENSKLTFLLLVFTLTVILGAMPQYFQNLNIYLLPFCILPILIRTFFDIRLAIYVHLLAMILIGFVAPNGFEFVFVQSIAGLMGLFSLVSLRKRSQLLTTAVVIFVSYSVTFISLSIIHEASLTQVHWPNLQWFAFSAILTLLVYPLIYIFEKLFGFLSDVTLMEISDTNSTLLRELNTKAPGTFQHSLQVANLAEAAVLKIGGDPLLIRTGALYHDIGKMVNPAYFIENQTPGFNPHDSISNEKSAEMIIAHVSEGVKIAKKHKLPQSIIDFIKTHHGTSLVRYFYTMQLNDKENKNVDKKDFQYPGPVPFSKETAVLMMADSVEAASRSMKEYSSESIQQLVNSIIDNQANDGQFENADITFRDLTKLKELFVNMLKTIYHVRIAYPEEVKE